MNKIFSFISLIFIVITQFQLGGLYVYAQGEINSEQEKNIQVLQNIDIKISKTVDTLEKKIKNKKKQKKLQKKKQEISKYLEGVQEEIKKEKNKTKIKQKTEKAAKVAVLKVISGVSDYEDIEKSIPASIAKNSKKAKKALEIMKQSTITKNGDYSLIIQTKKSQKKVKKIFSQLDETVKIKKMGVIKKVKYFELFIPKESNFFKEILPDIRLGILPKNLLGINIITPEVFILDPIISNQDIIENQKNEISELLKGEELNKTWGIQKYNPESYLHLLKKSPKKLRIGIIDTGIDYTHPDLDEVTVQGYDFVNDDNDPYDDQGHGTHVAGVIAGELNGEGIVGVNPYSELVPLKICNAEGFCPTYAALKAIEYAKQNNIDILNMSLGGRGDITSHPICDAITSAHNQGITVVSAAGNSNVDTATFIPGGCSDALAVSAVNQDNNKASFSNHGTKAITSAPGVGIYSTYPTNKGNYKVLSGTSMAAPHITGLVSIIKTLKPEVSNEEIKNIITTTGTQINNQTNQVGNMVTVDDLLGYFNKEDNITITNVEDEVVVEEKQEDNSDQSLPNPPFSQREGTGTDEILLKGVVNPNFVAPKGPEKVEVGENTQLTIKTTGPTEQIIDFGTQTELDLNINSQDAQEGVFETIDILETEETKKETITSSQIQHVDSEGNIITDPVEINALDEEVLTPGTGTLVGEDFDYRKLPEVTPAIPQDTGTGITDSEDSLEMNNIPEIQTLLIDGAEAPVEINSIEKIDVENLEPLEVGEYVEEGDKELPEELTEEEKEKYKKLQDEYDAKNLEYEKSIDKIEYNLSSSGAVEYKEYELEEINDNISINNVSILDSSVHNMTIEKGKRDKILTPSEAQYGSAVIYGNSSAATIFKDGGYIHIIGANVGDISYKIIFNNEIKYTLNVTVTPPPPTEIDIEIKQYTEHLQTLYNTNTYTFSQSSYNIASIGKNYNFVKIFGKEKGEMKFFLKDSQGILLYIFNVTVVEGVTPITKDIVIEQTKNHEFITDSWGYYRAQHFKGNGINISNRQNKFSINASGAIGKGSYYIINNSTGAVEYILNIEIIPFQPKIIEITLLETKAYSNFNLNLSARYTSTDPSMVRIWDHYTWFRSITALKPGYVEVYAHDYRTGRHEYTFKLTITPKPVPKKYTLDVLLRGSAQITIPDQISNYRLEVDNYNIYERGNSGLYQINDNTFSFSAYGLGESNIYLKDENGFPIYIIHVNVTLPELYYDVILTSTTNSNRSSKYSFTNYDRSIVSFSGKYFTALKEGKTTVEYTYNGQVRGLLHITVLPIPEPITIKCTVIMGDRCTTTGLYHDSYYYQESTPGVGTIDTGSHTFRVRGLKPGTIKVFITPRDANYIKYIYEVTVRSKPLRLFTCESPLGVLCNTNWWGSDKEYTYTVSDSSILDLSIYRYSEGDEHPKIYEKLQVKGKIEGVADVYVYENGEHTATFTITVTPAVPTIAITPGSATVDQRERADLQITAGGGEYKKVSADDSFIYFSVSNNADTTGEVTITGKEPGKTYPVIKDKYGQTATISVTVKDTQLRLNYSEANPLRLTGSNYEYIAIMESVGAIELINITNDNIDASLIMVDNNGKQVPVVKVVPKKSGETMLTVVDEENNPWVVKVIVGDVGRGGEPTNPIFKELLHIPSIEENGVGGMTFNIDGSVDEVGIDYETGDGEKKNIILENQADGEYVVAFVQDSCHSCTKLQPYFMKDNVKTSYSEVLLVDYNTTTVASEDSIKINSAGYRDFANMFSFLWIKGGYDTSYKTANQTIVDVKKDVKDFIVIQGQLVAYYTKLGAETGVEISGLGTLGRGTAATIAFWQGQITDNPYLTEEARKDLNAELALATGQEFPPVKLLSKFMTFGDKFIDYVKVGKKLKPGSDWAKYTDVVWSKVPKPDISKIKNENLKKFIKENYRDTSLVGNQSTADALRYERKTGILLSNSGHEQKVIDRRRELKSWLKSNANEYNPKASPEDIKIVKDILDDLNKAFNEKY